MLVTFKGEVEMRERERERCMIEEKVLNACCDFYLRKLECRG